MYTPVERIEFVFYEFCHFLQSNHSSKFYNELEKVFIRELKLSWDIFPLNTLTLFLQLLAKNLAL